jgi:energy-coupling factor transporter ATP-binding protein EcfA2
MYIERMKVERFRHVRDVDLGPFRQPSELGELIVLAGPNGGGKSSILELLSFGLATRYNYTYNQARRIDDHAFGIKLGLTDEELANLAEDENDQDALDYARKNRGYWVHVNLPTLFTGNELGLNDRVHAAVSRRFANFARRLGFFIRSDRAYNARNYRKDQLFNWQQRATPSHLQGISYGIATAQYEYMYDYLVEQSYHHVYQLGLHVRQQQRGGAGAPPQDPLTSYNDLLGRLFPGYAFQDVSEQDFVLRVCLPSGDVIPFQDMSSGEKEVFFILAFFIRNNVSRSPLVIDEPELHLHPELARKLIRHMRTIRPQNQIWIATHSADLIDEAGRERVVYVRRQLDNPSVGECVAADSDEAELQILRDLFGYSGFVGISQKVVFSEGTEASADRKMFTSLFPTLAEEIKIIPAGTVTNLARINRAVLSLLESDFARCEFYLIRDRDYLSDEHVARYEAQVQDRLFVLRRHHIENYLLDENVISEVLASVFQVNMPSAEVRDRLLAIARETSAAVLRDMVVARFSELYQQEDCSIGNHSNGLPLTTPDGEVNDEVFNPLRGALLERIRAVGTGVRERVTEERLTAILETCRTEVLGALNGDNNDWKIVFPGKALLRQFGQRNNLGRWPALQNLIIDAMAGRPADSFGDLGTVMARIVE